MVKGFSFECTLSNLQSPFATFPIQVVVSFSFFVECFTYTYTIIVTITIMTMIMIIDMFSSNQHIPLKDISPELIGVAG